MHLCYLIFLTGADGPLMLSSLMSLWSSISFITPQRGLCPMRRGTWSICPSRGRPSPSGVKGLPLLGAQILLRGRIPGLRCTHPEPRMTHGRTPLELEEAPGDLTSEPDLGQKPKLGGVRT